MHEPRIKRVIHRTEEDLRLLEQAVLSNWESEELSAAEALRRFRVLQEWHDEQDRQAKEAMETA